MTLRLTKHHALGNDFLVLLSDGPVPAALSTMAVELCERRRGVGADGLLFGGRGPAASARGADLEMVLHNADGSRAEMSGNGIRCLAQAEARRLGLDWADLRIATDAGVRAVQLRPGTVASMVSASVDMGAARPGPAPDVETTFDHDTAAGESLAMAPKERATVDLGNPHLVLLVDDPENVDLSAAGSLHEAAFNAGINVHFVAPTPGRSDTLTMRVWERGVGITDACGTGATAAAWAAHDWGLVGERVTVHMPGGAVEVVVGHPMTLIGPATFVAAVEVEQ